LRKINEEKLCGHIKIIKILAMLNGFRYKTCKYARFIFDAVSMSKFKEFEMRQK
jgi:hypothetical protein